MTIDRTTPVQGVPQHVLTWDRYQDGRIRVSLILGGIALTVAILALLMAFRRPPVQRPTVCPECPSLTVPTCPTCPQIPACPPIPQCPTCPSPRSSHGNHSHRNS